ncbi:MAG: hypothetical protein OIN86_07160 [Candidatus Methanoperedens sp.]|nr:hypothetical protein [Candidatus Methanoperedens sp.]
MKKVNDPSINSKYKETFEHIKKIKELKKNDVQIKLNDPLALPEYVMRHYEKDTCESVILSKLGTILKSVFQIHCDHIEPISTIYLFGPQCIGEWQFVNKFSTRLRVMGRDWTEEEVLHKGTVSISGSRHELEDAYEYNPEVKKVINLVTSLSTIDIVRLSYDFELNREYATGSVRVKDKEAFSQPIIDTLLRNYIESEIKRSKVRGPRAPKGSVQLSSIENAFRRPSNIREDDWAYFDDLKVGPSNNYLTFLAIYILNSFGDSANKESLARMLASHYLYEKKKPNQKMLIIDNRTIHNNIKKSLDTLLVENVIEKEKINEKDPYEFFVKGSILNGYSLQPHEFLALRRHTIIELKHYISNKKQKSDNKLN